MKKEEKERKGNGGGDVDELDEEYDDYLINDIYTMN